MLVARHLRSVVPFTILLCSWGLPDLAASGRTIPAGAEPAQAWQYGFAVGDHLEYAETLERETTGRDVHSVIRARYASHLLVMGTRQGMFSIGFQRNRQAAELALYTERGKDRLARERPAFDARMAAKPVAWSEANEVALSGKAQKPWQAVREAASRLLFGVHEIEPLPAGAMAPGARWEGTSILGLKFSYERQETIADEPCAVISGENKTVHVRYWFCPGSGYIRKLDYESRYETFGGSVHEHVAFHLQRIERSQKLADWLGDGSTSDAVLHGLLTSPWLAAEEAALATAVRASSAQTQALALAVCFHRDDAIPAPELQRLSGSTNPTVARLARQLADQPARHSVRDDQPTEAPGTTARFLRNGNFASAPYLLHVPLEYRGDKPFPLLVYLSGGAGIAIDAANASEAAIGEQPYLVIYPHSGGHMWWEHDSPALVDAVVNEVTGALNVDREHIYVAGFSNGGTGAIYLASLAPKRYAGIVSLMGGASCVPEIEPLRYKNLAAVPVLLVHGDADPVIPPDCSRTLYNRLRDVSPKALLELKILQKRAHDITIGADDGLTFRFLNSHVVTTQN